MPGGAYITSVSTGHGDFPPRATPDGSSNVIINGKGANRVGDSWPTHCNPAGVCHDGNTASGSSTVKVNGKPVARIGDPISCGGAIATGSSDVIIGG